MRTDLENLLDYMISSGYHDDETGHVDSPTGHVAIVDMTTPDGGAGRDLDVLRDTYLRDDPYATWPADLERAWYVVRTDDHGFLDITTADAEGATDALEQAEQAYAAWDDLDD